MARDYCVSYVTKQGDRISAGVYKKKAVAKAVFDLLAKHREFQFEALEIFQTGPCPEYYEGWRNHPQAGRIPFE